MTPPPWAAWPRGLSSGPRHPRLCSGWRPWLWLRKPPWIDGLLHLTLEIRRAVSHGDRDWKNVSIVVMRPRQRPSRRPARRKQDQFRKGEGAVERMMGQNHGEERSHCESRGAPWRRGRGGVQVGRQTGRNHPCSLEAKKEKVAARAPGTFLCVYVCLSVCSFKFIYLLVVLGLCCCVWAFLRLRQTGAALVVVHGLLIAVASRIAEHGL